MSPNRRWAFLVYRIEAWVLIFFFFQRKKWKIKDFMAVEIRIISPEKKEPKRAKKFRAILYRTEKRMNRSSLLRYF